MNILHFAFVFWTVVLCKPPSCWLLHHNPDHGCPSASSFLGFQAVLLLLNIRLNITALNKALLYGHVMYITHHKAHLFDMWKFKILTLPLLPSVFQLKTPKKSQNKYPSILCDNLCKTPWCGWDLFLWILWPFSQTRCLKEQLLEISSMLDIIMKNYDDISNPAGGT